MLGPGDAVVLREHLSVTEVDTIDNKRCLLAEKRERKKNEHSKEQPTLYDSPVGVYLGEQRLALRDRHGKGGWHGKGGRRFANTIGGVVLHIYHAFYFNEKIIMIDPKLVRVIVRYTETIGKE